MQLADIVRSRGNEWEPPPPIQGPSYLPDLRHNGYRSVYKVDGDILGQLREYLKASGSLPKATVEQKRPAAWEKLLWDEPWEPPPPPKLLEDVRILHVATIDGFAHFGRGSRDPGWPLIVGHAVQKGIARHAIKRDIQEPLNVAWHRLHSAGSRSRCNPSRDQGTIQYVADVELVLSAVSDFLPAWFEFLDTAVATAQASLMLPAPPVLVAVFTDFHLCPGAAQELEGCFKKMGHPRLLCLLGEEPV